ncbi:MAG: TolC family protein, partial [Pirellula sp.]
TFLQPLARGTGVYYTPAAIRIAGLRTNATLGSANRQLQEHAMDIIREYYELLLNRCLLSQSLNGQNRLYQIHEKLRSRVDIDLDKSQLSRSLAAIAKLQEQIATLRGNIRSNQARLRELVNSPLIKSPDCRELIPTTMPISMLVEVDLESEMIGALQLRGDVVEIQNRIEVARVERNIAKNDLRPQLDAIAETYVRGLQGNYDVGRAWTSQLDTGRPSYFAGAVYQSPYGNRAAKSQLQGRTAELARLIYDYEETLNAARAELESATYDSESLFEATDAAIQSTFATQDEVEHQMATFLSNFDGRKSVTSILSDLLDAEQRLIQAENNWVTKHILYMKALSQIKYESGTLLSIIAE